MKTQGEGKRVQIVSDGAYFDAEGKAILHAAVVQVSDDLLVQFGQSRNRYLYKGTDKRKDELCQAWEAMSYQDYVKRQDDRREKLARTLCALTGWPTSKDVLSCVIVTDAGPNNLLTLIWRERIQ